jgi:hypothetical protein
MNRSQEHRLSTLENQFGLSKREEIVIVTTIYNGPKEPGDKLEVVKVGSNCRPCVWFDPPAWLTMEEAAAALGAS